MPDRYYFFLWVDISGIFVCVCVKSLCVTICVSFHLKSMIHISLNYLSVPYLTQIINLYLNYINL